MKIIYETLKMPIMIGAGDTFYDIFLEFQKKDNLIFHVNLLTLKYQVLLVGDYAEEVTKFECRLLQVLGRKL